MNKPIIRHCKNCKWAVKWHGHCDSVYCDIKYKLYLDWQQRIAALLCKYYSQKDGVNNGI